MLYSRRGLTLLAVLLIVASCAKQERPASPAADPSTSDRGALVLGAVPIGYRDLGSTVAGKPGEGYFIGGPASASSDSDSSLGITHSKAVFDARKSPYSVKTSDCVGTGDTPAKAVMIQNLSDPADEVRAGIACAELQHPGAIWIAARLIVSDRRDRYLSVVALMDKQMQHIEVYTDVSRFAAKASATAP
jgi:hypothetical protein